MLFIGAGDATKETAVGLLGITESDLSDGGLDERVRELGIDAIVDVRLVWERSAVQGGGKRSCSQRRRKRQREAASEH